MESIINVFVITLTALITLGGWCSAGIIILELIGAEHTATVSIVIWPARVVIEAIDMLRDWLDKQ